MPKYDLSDFDKLSEENEFFGLLIKQYIQTKIDQEVKKVLEEIKSKIKPDKIIDNNSQIAASMGYNKAREEDRDLINTYLK